MTLNDVMLWLMILIGVGFVAVERIWPASKLPVVRAWWPRVILVNALNAALVFGIGRLWNEWLGGVSLVRLADHVGDVAAGIITYLVAAFVYYWWHRFRHESRLLWLLLHQLHHSPRRMEVAMAFYKHPVEIGINAILSSVLAYTLMGCTPIAAAVYMVLAGTAEFFYHANIRTPRWLGWIVQRPGSHRIHHQRGRHTANFGDLPIFDWFFGTFKNGGAKVVCGFKGAREDRVDDMLAFRDVNGPAARKTAPLHFLPACIGCKKRWACREARSSGE
jgi:sterol desaturase/sphingolipid hydroxylase (fatty acid hydroxylase superfamily)